MIYLFDTNAVSDLMKRDPGVRRHIEAARLAGHTLGICRPVYYELRRGLIRTNASAKAAALEAVINNHFGWLPLRDQDWEQAAQFWADAVRQGRQLATVDLLIAALAQCLDAVLVSSDADFEPLPVAREDWRAA